MSYYYIVARSGDDRTELTHHHDREHAADAAEGSAGTVRPVSESVVDGSTPVCSECVPFGDASGGESSGTDEKASDSTLSDSSSDEGNGPDGSGGDTDAGSVPTCAGTTSGGDPCSREVDAEGEFCFQHS